MQATMKKILLLCFLLVVLINHHHVVECRPVQQRHRRQHHRKDDYMMFVFGDSFVDAGNRPPTSEKTGTSRQWFYPYGISDSAHGNRATGRCSNGLVQSDFLARMLGQDESPPAYRLRQTNDDVDLSGVNFAMAGSGVTSSLGTQIDQFRTLVRRETIDDEDLENSVALIAFSGLQDYSELNVAATSDEIMALADKVIDKIAEGVRRLQELRAEGVRRLPSPAATSDGTSKPEGYCGQDDASGRAQYSLCSNPEDFFYWDYVHPTHAGWEAVMDRLENPILDFLDIYS